jgi:enoyl-CoA hydratase/carnithine racemase
VAHDDDEFEHVTFTVDGGVALVTLNRPERLNAFTGRMGDELGRVYERCDVDDTVRVVVLTGAGRAFCAGADFERGSETFASPGTHGAREFTASPVRPRAWEVRKPVIAAINGHALGGGSELTLCCDYRVMVEDGRSRIGQTESALGIIPGAGGTQRLPRLIGKAKAMRYLIESTRLSAKEAEAVGWVDMAVAPDEFQAAVDALAGKLAKAATFAIAMIKDAVRRGYDLPLDEALEIEAGNFARAALSTDAAIGIMSFLSKQEPEYTGS